MPHLATAWRAFWAILTSDDKANAWNTLQTPQLPPATPAPATTTDTDTEPEPQPAPAQAANTNEAVHALAILQRESRLIDFLQENLDEADDEQIGAAVRKIHADAQAALHKYFGIVPVQNAAEGDAVTLPADFDSRAIRLTGKPAGAPPYHGTLVHKGWRAANVKLPVSSAAVDPTVIAPAEVEI